MANIRPKKPSRFPCATGDLWAARGPGGVAGRGRGQGCCHKLTQLKLQLAAFAAFAVCKPRAYRTADLN